MKPAIALPKHIYDLYTDSKRTRDSNQAFWLAYLRALLPETTIINAFPANKAHLRQIRIQMPGGKVAMIGFAREDGLDDVAKQKLDMQALQYMVTALDVSVPRTFFVGDDGIVFYDTKGSRDALKWGNKRQYDPFNDQDAIHLELIKHLEERMEDVI